MFKCKMCAFELGTSIYDVFCPKCGYKHLSPHKPSDSQQRTCDNEDEEATYPEDYFS